MIRLEMPQKAVVSRGSDTIEIDGVTVRLMFAQVDNRQITKMVRDTLKESYNRRLSA